MMDIRIVKPSEWKPPEGGAKEWQKSASGRRYLARLQEEFKAEIVQPGNREFEKRYGQKRSYHQ